MKISTLQMKKFEIKIKRKLIFILLILFQRKHARDFESYLTAFKIAGVFICHC